MRVPAAMRRSLGAVAALVTTSFVPLGAAHAVPVLPAPANEARAGSNGGVNFAFNA